MWLGERLIAEDVAMQARPPDEQLVIDLHKRSMAALRDAERYVRHHASVEVQLAVTEDSDIQRCDRTLLKALAVVFHSQFVSGADFHPSLSELYRICHDVHDDMYSEYFHFRMSILNSIFAGLYCSNRNPWMHSSAIIRMSPRLAFAILGSLHSDWLASGTWDGPFGGRTHRGINMNEWTLTPDRYLSQDELAVLLKKAEDLRTLGLARNQKQPVRDWAIIRFALLSGLRANELAQMKVADCFVGYGRSELLVRRGKGGKSRVVKIGDDLKKDIRWFLGWKKDNGELADGAYLLRSQRAESMTPGAIWRRWKLHCPNHRLHDARHTYGTILYGASKDLRLVQSQLGHSRPTVTAVYAQVTDEQARAGVQALENAVGRLAKKGQKDCELPKNLRRKPAKVAGTIAG